MYEIGTVVLGELCSVVNESGEAIAGLGHTTVVKSSPTVVRREGNWGSKVGVRAE